MPSGNRALDISGVVLVTGMGKIPEGGRAVSAEALLERLERADGGRVSSQDFPHISP